MMMGVWTRCSTIRWLTALLGLMLVVLSLGVVGPASAARATTARVAAHHPSYVCDPVGHSARTHGEPVSHRRAPVADALLAAGHSPAVKGSRVAAKGGAGPFP